MRLKNHFESMTMRDRLVAVPVGNGVQFNGALKLNKTAAAIFELLKDDVSQEQIVDALSRQFDAPRELLEKDVQNCIDEFRQKDLLID